MAVNDLLPLKSRVVRVELSFNISTMTGPTLHRSTNLAQIQLLQGCILLYCWEESIGAFCSQVVLGQDECDQAAISIF